MFYDEFGKIISVYWFEDRSSFLTKEKFEILKIIVILKGEMLNLYLEDIAAVKNVDIASGKASKKWFASSIQMHGKKIQMECLFVRLMKA